MCPWAHKAGKFCMIITRRFVNTLHTMKLHIIYFLKMPFNFPSICRTSYSSNLNVTTLMKGTTQHRDIVSDKKTNLRRLPDTAELKENCCYCTGLWIIPSWHFQDLKMISRCEIKICAVSTWVTFS